MLVLTYLTLLQLKWIDLNWNHTEVDWTQFYKKEFLSNLDKDDQTSKDNPVDKHYKKILIHLNSQKKLKKFVAPNVACLKSNDLNDSNGFRCWMIVMMFRQWEKFQLYF